MLFPIGEWLILFLTLEAWLEKRASRQLFLFLTMAWFAGKGLEFMFPASLPWHWHFARLSVMMVFWGFALSHAEHWFLPLTVTGLVAALETLFQANEPGVFANEAWVFVIILIVVAWFSTRTFWGTAAACAGSIVLDQLFVRFAFDGLIRYADLPEDFVWNFGVSFFTLWAGLNLSWEYYQERAGKTRAETLTAGNPGGCETGEERELQ